MCLGLSGHISTSFRCTPVTHGSALTSLNLGCTRHSRSTLHSALICTRFPGTRALCVASCPVKTRGKLSHHIGAPRRSGAWKALLLVTEGNALGPHVRPISICLEGSTPQDRTSPRNEICPTRPNPCFKRNGSVDIQWGIIEPVPRHRCPQQEISAEPIKTQTCEERQSCLVLRKGWNNYSA